MVPCKAFRKENSATFFLKFPIDLPNYVLWVFNLRTIVVQWETLNLITVNVIIRVMLSVITVSITYYSEYCYQFNSVFVIDPIRNFLKNIKIKPAFSTKKWNIYFFSTLIKICETFVYGKKVHVFIIPTKLVVPPKIFVIFAYKK